MKYLLFLLFSLNTYASIFPPNDLYIPIGDKDAGMTKEQFDQALDEVEKVYTPFIKNEYNATLIVHRAWDDGTVNAYAYKDHNLFHIKIFGGLARHPQMTLEALQLATCHEIGHHIGGLPREDHDQAWAAVEGQADYFATNKCLKKVWLTTGNLSLANKSISPLVSKQCQERFKGNEYKVCVKGAMAGLSVAKMFQSISQETVEPQFATRDLQKVFATDEDHPATQCRLDTYFAGALCTTKLDEKVTNKGYGKGNCFHWGGLAYDPEDRPLCWFYHNGLELAQTSIQKYDNKKLKNLLDKKLDPNLKDKEKLTLLNHAIMRRNHEGMKLLSHYGAKLTYSDADKNRITHFAARYGNKETINTLQTLGANFSEVNKFGQLALNSSIKFQNYATLESLVEQGQKINHRDYYKQTPLYEAAVISPKMIQKVYDLGAQVNITSQYGMTPLITSIRSDKLNIMQKFIDLQADVNLGGFRNNSPLHYAVKSKNEDMILLLVKSKANIYKKNDHGQSPYNLAKKYKLSEKVLNALK